MNLWSLGTGNADDPADMTTNCSVTLRSGFGNTQVTIMSRSGALSRLTVGEEERQ